MPSIQSHEYCAAGGDGLAEDAWLTISSITGQCYDNVQCHPRVSEADSHSTLVFDTPIRSSELLVRIVRYICRRIHHTTGHDVDLDRRDHRSISRQGRLSAARSDAVKAPIQEYEGDLTN